MVFNDQLEILQISDNMPPRSRTAIRESRATGRKKLTEVFCLRVTGSDEEVTTWEALRIALETCSSSQHAFCFETLHAVTRNGNAFSFVGKIILLNNHAAVFLCSPNAESLADMYDQEASIRDMKRADESRLQMLLNEKNVQYFKDLTSEVCATTVASYYIML